MEVFDNPLEKFKKILLNCDLKESLEKLGVSTNLITHADINNKTENSLRLQVLKDYREWFDLDTDTYTWQLVALSQNEVGELQYIDYSYWDELSKNTRLVKDAVETIKSGQRVFNVPNDSFYSIATGFENNQAYDPIIVITKHTVNEIIEGHARATGYALATNTPKPLQAIIGTSK